MALVGIPPPSRLRGLPESTQRQFDYFYEWIQRLFGFLAGFGATITVTINGNTNNLGNSDFDGAQFIRLNVTTAANITGIRAPLGLFTRKTLVNVGSANLTLPHQDSNSSASNRFTLPGSISLVMLPNDTQDVWYDGVSLAWRPV